MNKVFITGATGFIGGRLAEILHSLGIPSVALVRNWSAASRLSRLPVEKVQGDLMDRDSIRRAVRGCDTVFHCAVDNRTGGAAFRRSIPITTRNLLEAALQAGAKRVVVLSSIAVHGYDPRPEAGQEETPLRISGVPYCDGKAEAEKISLKYHRRYGLPVVILRPTIVYGPFSGWTSGITGGIASRRLPLLDRGEGICNPVYVDNLVHAMLLSTRGDSPVGKIFNISDAQTVSWKTFLESHAGALGEDFLPLPEIHGEELQAFRREFREQAISPFQRAQALIRDINMEIEAETHPFFGLSWKKGKHWTKNVLQGPMEMFARKIAFGAPPPSPAPETKPQPLRPRLEDIQIQTSRVTFSIQNAQRFLDYKPPFSFEEGMKLTSDWIRWAFRPQLEFDRRETSGISRAVPAGTPD